jgi:hypothetical protein
MPEFRISAVLTLNDGNLKLIGQKIYEKHFKEYAVKKDDGEFGLRKVDDTVSQTFEADLSVPMMMTIGFPLYWKMKYGQYLHPRFENLSSLNKAMPFIIGAVITYGVFNILLGPKSQQQITGDGKVIEKQFWPVIFEDGKLKFFQRKEFERELEIITEKPQHA